MIMELQGNQIVQNARGDIGYVAVFNGKPIIIIYQGYPTQTKRFNENLEHNNPNYSIVKIWDGSLLENPVVVYNKSFDFSTLPLIWEKTL